MATAVLIEKLKSLENMESMAQFSGKFINPGMDEEDHYPPEGLAVLKEIDGIIDDILITQKGRPNFDAIIQLKDAGFRVGPGEQDDFGWLTGVVYTRRGKIVFG